MITLLPGIAIFILSVYAAIHSVQGTSAQLLFQLHAVELIVGGTVGIFLLSNPPHVLRNLFSALRDFVRPDYPFRHHRQTLAELAQNKFSVSQSAHPLIQYASQLWNQGVDHDTFVEALLLRKKEMERYSNEAIQSIRSLGKYPPALGMIGTVISMVSMFQGLENQQAEVGLKLSVAMTATFLGLLLSNAVISPAADRLTVRHMAKKKELEAICEILGFIHSGEPASFIREEIKIRAA